MGWGFADKRQVAPLRRLSWWYNWGLSSAPRTLNATRSAGLEFVPMQARAASAAAPLRQHNNRRPGQPRPAVRPPARRRTSSDTLETWPPHASQWGIWGAEALDPDSLPAGVHALLGFNEPNHGAQAGIPAREAAVGGRARAACCVERGSAQALWHTFRPPFERGILARPPCSQRLWPHLEAVAEKRGLRLGAPAASPCGANCLEPDPFRWWDEFFFWRVRRPTFILPFFRPRQLGLWARPRWQDCKLLPAVARFGTRRLWRAMQALPLPPAHTCKKTASAVQRQGAPRPRLKLCLTPALCRCKGCRVDFLATHYYACNAGWLAAYLNQAK